MLRDGLRINVYRYLLEQRRVKLPPLTHLPALSLVADRQPHSDLSRQAGVLGRSVLPLSE
jgi:hypothetical protein